MRGPTPEVIVKNYATAAGFLVLLGTGIAMAGPIEDRQAIMKSFDPAEAVIRRMVAPGGTLDLAAAKTQLQVFVDGATKFPMLFPAGSDTGAVRTSASPAIWTDTAGFQAAAAKLVTDAKAAQTATDQASFTAAWQTVETDCGGCHRTYRVRQVRPAPPPPAQ